MPGMIFLALFDGQRRFLNCVNRSGACFIFQVVTVIIHVGWCYLFVFTYKLDVYGLGVAGSITNFTLYVCVLIYTSTVEELKPAIFWPEKDTLSNTKQYLAYGVPSTLMMCLQWWS